MILIKLLPVESFVIQSVRWHQHLVRHQCICYITGRYQGIAWAGVAEVAISQCLVLARCRQMTACQHFLLWAAAAQLLEQICSLTIRDSLPKHGSMKLL